MSIPSVPEIEILKAFEVFDNDIRHSWRDWYNRKNHKYAIVWESKIYPVKEIIRLATGYTLFSGGKGSSAANSYLQNKGYTIVSLDDEIRSHDFHKPEQQISPFFFQELFRTLNRNNYDVRKLSQLEKETHKEIWSAFKSFLENLISKIDTNFVVKSHRWIIGQYLLDYFWFEVQRKNRTNSASSISISLHKDGLQIKLEWSRKKSKSSTNNLDHHNNWIHFITTWVQEYNLNLDLYKVWVLNENVPITLNQFINNEQESEKIIKEQEENSVYSYRVGFIIPKEDIFTIDDFAAHITDFFIQLTGIYRFTIAESPEEILTDDEAREYPEGKLAFKMHRQRERNKRLIKDAKALFVNKHGKLFCEACNLDFTKIYGDRGKDFIEGHHKKLISELKEGESTKVQDIAMLCSNCHRMIHKTPLLNVEELSLLIKNNRSKYSE